MVTRIVNRYVEQVVDLLPFWEKSHARKALKDVIFEMLEDYCEGQRPVGRDARAVLSVLGSPEELANQYYEFRSRQKKRRKVNVRHVVNIVQNVLVAAAAVLIFCGMLALALHVTNNLAPMVIGGVMAVAVVMTRILMPAPEVRHGSEKEETKKKEEGVRIRYGTSAQPSSLLRSR